MNDFIVDKEKNIILYRDANELYLSISSPKVIFGMNETSQNRLLLTNQIQHTCRYSDFVACLNFVCDYLFSKSKIEEIVTQRPCFDKSLFFNDGYTFDGDYIVKKRELEKNRGM